MAQTNGTVTIVSVKGYQIFDSRNNPTVAVKMQLSDGKSSWFKVPSGASTGEKEALELRDGGSRFRGKGVSKAVNNVNGKIAPAVKGLAVKGKTQKEFDELLIRLDGTENKSNLGANAILAVSGAFARAQAHAEGVPLWKHFASPGNLKMPVPQFNVLNAGNHADTGFEVQETLIIPAGAKSFAEAMEMGTNVWYALKSSLAKAGHTTGKGDEGGFVNPFKTIEQTSEAVLAAIQGAGYAPGKDIWLAFDGAFSEIFGKDLKEKKGNANDLTYHLNGKRLTSEEVGDFWKECVSKYPVISIEDGMSENDKQGWRALTKMLGNKVQLVLDDYICTNPVILKQAIADGIGNSSLIKLNQIGTVTETLNTMEMTRRDGRSNAISHRSGETEDDFLGHLAMHANADQIKCGSSGSERNAKYNALLIIEAETGAGYRGLGAFPKSVKR
ncbi:Enolase [Candidatus Gugararchaeum adminiculabundum]|nr:Enolase [Candidatus Gugararchaeum adminiculabundum]